MVYSEKLDSDRRFLIDYLSFRKSELQEHVGYVRAYLRTELPFLEMLEHAKQLHCANGNPRKYPDLVGVVKDFSRAEITVVKRYMLALANYADGRALFDSVDSLADELIKLKPIPASAKLEPDSEFYKGEPGRTLADMRKQV